MLWSFLLGNLYLRHKSISKWRDTKILVDFTFPWTLFSQRRRRIESIPSLLPRIIDKGDLRPPKVKCIHLWMSRDCCSGAGHFHFPAVLEPKLAWGTEAEDSHFLRAQEGRSRDLLRGNSEALALICPMHPTGNAGSGRLLGPMLRQEVKRGRKPCLPWRRDWREQEDSQAQFKELNIKRVYRVKVLLICMLTDFSNYIHLFLFFKLFHSI